MGMFGKTTDIEPLANAEQVMKKVENEAISSIIDQTMEIRGEIVFQGKARIDGIIHGNIEGEHLVLSETGKIDGDIAVSSFNCYGVMEGNVKAGMLTARKNCSIKGTLEAGSLTVEPGAAIHGEIKVAVRDIKPVGEPAKTAPSTTKK